jgi:hypothetical protein
MAGPGEPAGARAMVFIPVWNEEGALPGVLADAHKELPGVDTTRLRTAVMSSTRWLSPMNVGAGRSQVQILSPRSEKRPAYAGLLRWSAVRESGRQAGNKCPRGTPQRGRLEAVHAGA